MRFLNLFKKKEESKKKYEKDSIYGKWEDGLISAEDVMLMASCDFYKAALYYMNDIRTMKNSVKEHNDKIPYMQEILESVLSKESYNGKETDIMLLQLHKNDKSHAFSVAKFRGLTLIAGMSALETMESCDEIRKDESLDISKENLLKYCNMPEIQEFAIDEYINDSHREITKEEVHMLCPTDTQLDFFYDAVYKYCRLLEEGHIKKTPFDVDNLFTEEWIMQLPDENGTYHVVEENYFKDYIEMDYKGVV